MRQKKKKGYRSILKYAVNGISDPSNKALLKFTPRSPEEKQPLIAGTVVLEDNTAVGIQFCSNAGSNDRQKQLAQYDVIRCA